MEQEKAPQKRKTTRSEWIMFGCIILLSACCITLSLKELVFPLHTEKLEGTIVAMDENGEVIPYPSFITVTVFSHYAPSPYRSETGRTKNHLFDYYDNDTGIFGAMIPRFPVTLFFHSQNGKYAAVVDIAKDAPTTGLEVTLRPRHSVTGRLLDRSGAPLANYEFRLEFMRRSEAASGHFRRVAVETFELLYSKTDADGFFTVDRLIPGVEYNLVILQPENVRGFSSVTMPILEPEQYQEPFDLGDVSIR